MKLKTAFILIIVCGLTAIMPASLRQAAALTEIQPSDTSDHVVALAEVQFTVNVTEDSDDGSCDPLPGGDCTLREAINAANANTGQDTIAFNIPGDGPHTIVLLTALPEITDPVQIDGCSQPGADCSQWPPTLRIALHDDSTTSSSILTLVTNNSTVRGLNIYDTVPTSLKAAISITGMEANNNWIYANFVGTNETGSIAQERIGIEISYDASNNIIGTNGDGISDDLERNIILGEVSLYQDASHNVIAGNLVGVDVSGTQKIDPYTGCGGSIGLYLNSNYNRIGTNGDGISDILEQNTIAACVDISYGSQYNIIAGNHIGVNTTGTAILVNQNSTMGVIIQAVSAYNQVGTNADGIADIIEGNVIGGHNTLGVAIIVGAHDNAVAGNFIGTDVSGTVSFGNILIGIQIWEAYNNRIGGNNPGEGNTIAFSQEDGIQVGGENVQTGNTILGNAIYANGGLGITLHQNPFGQSDGVTPNDPGDPDVGANNLQNYPVLTAVTPTTVEGTLNSTPNTTFTLDFYSNTVCDESGYGEGEMFQPVTEPATVTTDANGDVTFSFTFVNPIPVAHTVVTATATDPDGSTSEFSMCRAMTGSLSIDDVSVLESNQSSAVFTVTLSQASTEIVTVDYASANDTATAGSDYTAVEGTLIFDPGVTSQPINVPILEDTRDEGEETFVINLSNPMNAWLADDQGTGTITDRIARLVSPADSSRINDATPRFTWRAADSATAYRLQVDNNTDFSSPVLSKITSSTVYTLTEELGNRRYFWRVRAKHSSGQWGAWSEHWSFTVDTRAPDVPVLRSPANHATIRDDTPTFDWQGSTGADRYRLQVDNNADFSSPVISITISATNYTRPASLSDRVYYWRVQARDAAGNASGWSAKWSFTLNAVRPEPEATATLSPTRTPTETPTLTPTPTEILIEPLLRVESDHPAVQQTGMWTSHTTDAASGGSYLYSSGGFDDTLTLMFSGTQLEVIYVKHPALGTFAVEIDGTVMQLVDSAAPESEFGAITVVSGLADGQHTLRVYPVAGVVALDAFGVDALSDITVPPTLIPTDPPTLDVAPTDVPPDQPTLTPSATNTPLPVTLPFVETFDSGLNWIPVGAWTFDTQTAYRGAGWFASSTTRGQSSTLTFGAQIDLQTALYPELGFWQKMALANADLFAVEVSLDGGLTWQALDLQSGSTKDWTQRALDLTAYRGQVISLRFRLDTLNALPEGAVTMGVWIDELVIQEAQPTPTPIPTETPTTTPTLTLSPSVTPSETPSPTTTPTDVPTATPTETPTPTELPSETPEPGATEEPGVVTT